MTSGKRLLAKVAPYARIVSGISHPHRLAILYLLSHESMCPEDLSRHLPIRLNLISHHLKALADSGWLTKRRVGKHVMYSVRKRVFRELPLLLADTPFWRSLQKPV